MRKSTLILSTILFLFSGPNDALHIVADTGQDAFRVQTGGTTRMRIFSDGAVVFGNTDSVGAGVVYVKNQLGLGVTNPTYRIQLSNSSNNLLGKGQAFAWSTYSGQRVKRTIKNSAYGLKEVLQLRPVQYDHHSSNFENGQLILQEEHESKVGFIAQEVYEIIQEVVEKPVDESEEFWSMNYEKLTPVLVTAIQELVKENEILKANNADQELRLSAVEKFIADLEKKSQKDAYAHKQ